MLSHERRALDLVSLETLEVLGTALGWSRLSFLHSFHLLFINNDYSFPLHLPAMSELNQFWDFPEAQERIRLDRDVMLCNGFQHTFGFESAADQRPFYSHIAEDELVKGDGDFCWL